jgi:hypothetical protein
MGVDVAFDSAPSAASCQVLADKGIDWQGRAVAPGDTPSYSQVQASRHGVGAVSASRRDDAMPDHRHRDGRG